MTLLILGLLLWVAVHLFKRVSPSARASLDVRFGKKARGGIALLLLGSIVLMVMGYRAAPIEPVYQPLAGAGHLNNLLMLIAVFLIGAGSAKGVTASKLRHPMLLAVIVWAGAHLLVNGDLASIILFGGTGLWAIVEMVVISRAEGPWQRPAPGPIKKDIRVAVISVVLFAVFAGVHILLGHNPFLGTYA